MAIEKHQRLKKIEVGFTEDGRIEHRWKTVDDGYMNDGVFESGAIRRLEATAEEVEAAVGVANTVTEGQVRAVRVDLEAQINKLTEERDEALRRIVAANRALN